MPPLAIIENEPDVTKPPPNPVDSPSSFSSSSMPPLAIIENEPDVTRPPPNPVDSPRSDSSCSLATLLSGLSDSAGVATSALDKDSSIGAKIDCCNNLGLFYTQKMNSSVTLTAAAKIDVGKWTSNDGHSCGFKLAFK